MSVSTEEVVQYPDFMPEPAVDRLILEADADHLDFIPDDPAELRRAVTRMAAHINLADWRFIKPHCRHGTHPRLAGRRLLQSRQLAGPPLRPGTLRSAGTHPNRPGAGATARIDAAFRDGVISYSKVRAITRVATPDTDAMLLAITEGSSAAHLESLVRTYERVGKGDGERAAANSGEA